jgi:two-component system, NtrC family, response regulator AtoC
VLEDQVIRRVGGVRDMQVDVRVIAASNRDLERAVREGHFRQDLYYRLAIISIFLPTLRERKEDILPLVEFFISHYNRKFRKSVQGLAEGTRRLLLNYNWPGNVRELKNALERAMILEEGPQLKPDDLPFAVASGHSGATSEPEVVVGSTESGWRPKHPLPALSIPEGGTSLEEMEHAMVEMALRQARGNQIRAAKLLDISRDALRYKMKKFGLGHHEEAENSTTASSDST